MTFIFEKKEALESPSTLATVVHAILLDKYGEEFYEWDPLTVYLEVKDDFNADMSPQVVDKLAAIQVIMTTDAFFKRLDAFMAICNTLADGRPYFDIFNEVTVEEAAWAISEVALNREMLPFSYPIKYYLKAALKNEGFDETDYPVVFDEVFGKPVPSNENIRNRLAARINENNIDEFINEQMSDLVIQFDKIGDMKTLDKLILDRGVEEAVKANKEDQKEDQSIISE